MIPDEAVEAAARAMYASQYADPFEKSSSQSEFREMARAALDSVAPHLMAGAWEQGAIAGWKQSGEGWNVEYPDESTGALSVDLQANPFKKDDSRD